jgi:hypothetical protein
MNYSEEEKEVIDKIETLCKYLDVWKENYTIVPEDKRYFKTLLNLIQKQEKEIHKLKIIIENMAENLAQGCNYEEFEYQKQKIIESFKKEVEKEC